LQKKSGKGGRRERNWAAEIGGGTGAGGRAPASGPRMGWSAGGQTGTGGRPVVGRHQRWTAVLRWTEQKKKIGTCPTLYWYWTTT
jgi:hypothetical protein